MDNDTMTREQAAAVFADPIGYLAGLGVEAHLDSDTTLAEAA